MSELSKASKGNARIDPICLATKYTTCQSSGRILSAFHVNEALESVLNETLTR